MPARTILVATASPVSNPAVFRANSSTSASRCGSALTDPDQGLKVAYQGRQQIVDTGLQVAHAANSTIARLRRTALEVRVGSEKERAVPERNRHAPNGRGPTVAFAVAKPCSRT